MFLNDYYYVPVKATGRNGVEGYVADVYYVKGLLDSGETGKHIVIGQTMWVLDKANGRPLRADAKRLARQHKRTKNGSVGEKEVHFL